MPIEVFHLHNGLPRLDCSRLTLDPIITSYSSFSLGVHKHHLLSPAPSGA